MENTDIDFQTRFDSLMADLELYKEALTHGSALLQILEEEVGKDDRSTAKIKALLVSMKLTCISPIESLGEEIDLILGECTIDCALGERHNPYSLSPNPDP